MSQDPLLLSVIVPVYNEERTVSAVLDALLAGPYRGKKEILVVDDGSEDGTAVCLQRYAACPEVIIIRHWKNRGKGAAIQTALRIAQGEICIIQDADQEYDPTDLPRLVEPIRCGEGPVVYGSRYLHPDRRLPWTRFRVAVAFLNFMVRVLFRVHMTDEATCYKACRTELLRRLNLESHRFEFCAEITAKLCRLRIPIREVPISFHPRDRSQGKKIGWRDAWPSTWTLLRWRLSPLAPLAASVNR